MDSKRRSKFQDIADNRFYFSNRRYLKWLEMNGTVYAVVAEGLDSKYFTICSNCPRYYQYLLLRWDDTRKTFILTHSIQSRTMIYPYPTRFQEELDYIKKEYSASQKWACKIEKLGGDGHLGRALSAGRRRIKLDLNAHSHDVIIRF